MAFLLTIDQVMNNVYGGGVLFLEVNKVTVHNGIDILQLVDLFVDKYRIDTDGGRSDFHKGPAFHNY